MYFLKEREFIKKIDLEQVYFFTRQNSQVVVVYRNRTDRINVSLSYISELLRKNSLFFRCHKSYIVNINKIEQISKYTNKTYNIKFNGIKECAFMTAEKYKIFSSKINIL